MQLPDFEQCLTARLFKKESDLGYTSVHSSLDRQSCKVFFFSTHPFQEEKDLEISHNISLKGPANYPPAESLFYNVATNKVQQVTSCLFPHRCNTDRVTLSLIRFLIVIVIVIDPLSEVYFHKCIFTGAIQTEWPCHWSTISSVFSTGAVLVKFCWILPSTWRHLSINTVECWSQQIFAKMCFSATTKLCCQAI